MTSTIEIATVMSEPIQSRPYGQGEMLTLPWSYGDGSLVELYVERVAADLVTVSDRTMTAFHLSDVAGLDLATGVAARSWQAVLESAGVPIDLTARPWEIATTVDDGDLDRALRRIIEACLRADGLRFLAKGPRRLSFGARVTSLVSEVAQSVVPNQTVSLRSGGQRSVTVEATRGDGRRVLVQAMSSADRTAQCDHAYFLADQIVDRAPLVGALEGTRIQWANQALGAFTGKMTLAGEDELAAVVAAA